MKIEFEFDNEGVKLLTPVGHPLRPGVFPVEDDDQKWIVRAENKSAIFVISVRRSEIKRAELVDVVKVGNYRNGEAIPLDFES